MSSNAFLTELRCAEALARAAGQRIEIGRRAGVTVDYKGRNDLVTNVDREVETFLRAEIKELFPEDRIVGEEYGTEDGVDGDGEDGLHRQWLIDPIDGTTNFSMGVPIYCVSIALFAGGETVVGAIYDPTRDELFSARRGHGTRVDGMEVKSSAEQDLSHAVMVTGFPPIKTDDTFESIVWKFGHVARASRGVRRLGSAALDLAYIATGRIDGFWEFNLNPWDTAAGYLMVEEAGGRVTQADGAPFSPFAKSVVATNGHIHDSLLDVLKSAKIS
jgi:myo-inositol-1(or 4)-monophosphatase